MTEQERIAALEAEVARLGGYIDDIFLASCGEMQERLRAMLTARGEAG